MTDDERRSLAQRMEDQVRPLLDRDRLHGGYNCCGCSTYDDILDHCLAIVLGYE